MAALPTWSHLATFGRGILADYIKFVKAVRQIRRLPSLPVSIFGGSRLQADSIWHQKAEELGRMLARRKVPVMTGGGPGVMHAVSCGIAESGEPEMADYLFGITVKSLGDENPCIGNVVRMNYFFTRKLLLIYYSCGFVVFPGGYGTLDELGETLTLIQTQQRLPAPVILMGREFWQPFLCWIETEVQAHGLVSEEDTKLFVVTDSVAEAAGHLIAYHDKQHSTHIE